MPDSPAQAGSLAGETASGRILAPEAVERIRYALGRRGATLVSVLAYAGLRPSEALALRWCDVGERSLLVLDHPWQAGRAGSGTGGRTVRLLRPVADDLAEWRVASSHPGQGDPVFHHPSGDSFSERDWRQWRERRFVPAVAMAGLLALGPRPLDLRHTFALLLAGAGVAIGDVAEEMGIDAVAATASYGHLAARGARETPRSGGGAILAARKSVALGREGAATGTSAPREDTPATGRLAALERLPRPARAWIAGGGVTPGDGRFAHLGHTHD